MHRLLLTSLIMLLAVSFNAQALTGSGESGAVALETVSPTLDSVSTVTERSLSVMFSEAMRTPDVMETGKYVLSGLGLGTLPSVPDSVSGLGPYTLLWPEGEMRNGAPVTVTAAGLQDAVGNPIHPAHNSATCAGLGIAPVFTNLLIHPAQAFTGEMVTITFTCSEPLDGDPGVAINGNNATWVSGQKGVDFTYTYEIQEGDPLGMANVSVTGFDLAGNLGSLNSDAALEIVEEQAGLPLYAWPAGLALLAVGIVLLIQKRRVGAATLMLALVASGSALAAPPSVSDITVRQVPFGGTTQVEISYGLSAPNGPCDITVWLSKDGGADGYVWPVTSVTGDLENVTAPSDNVILWDIRADYPEEDIPNAHIRLVADDGIVQHTLTYTAGEGGAISGDTPQTVNHGSSGTQVTAVPDTNYHFVEWSDHVLTETRTDMNVVADISVTASFAINTFICTYTAGPGGSISGSSPQTVNYGGNSTLVTAVPDTGYHFIQWSDGYTGTDRVDSFVIADIDVTAEFEPNANLVFYWANPMDAGSVSGPATILTGGTAAFTVSTNPGYTYQSIMAIIGDVTGSYPNFTLSNVTADVTVTADFIANTNGITYAVSPLDAGTLTGPPTVMTGDSASLTVTQNAGYTFQNITATNGNVTGSFPDFTLSGATAETTVTANFTLNQYTLTYTAGMNGSVTGDSPQTVNHGDSGTQVTAVPNGGYVFLKWSDGVLTAERTDTNVTADINVTAIFGLPVPVITSFAINSGAATTMPLGVTLNNTATNSPVDCMASESASFSGATWQPYGTAPSLTLAFGAGMRTVYFKARNGIGESDVVSDTIFVVPNTVSVAAGTFTMGRTSAGDDAARGWADELPLHSVTLGAYQLGKGEVTNKEYCDVLNWALAQGYLQTSTGVPWTGTGDIYAGGARYLVVKITHANCNIQYSGGVFMSKMRVGLPGTTNYSTDTHPMVHMSWFGSVAFCNWLSQWQGLTPCYDMNTANWPLTLAPPTPGGYRLPTEAEWERAAGWDATIPKHWIYCFISDTNPDGTVNRCNDNNSGTSNDDNPLGLTSWPHTSPIMWFNGWNVNPNGGVATVNSPSPVGAYDMSGNVYEFCQDWYLDTYYNGGPMTNPTGPATGWYRVRRGGAWDYPYYHCRAAFRNYSSPTETYHSYGFRLAKSQ